MIHLLSSKKLDIDCQAEIPFLTIQLRFVCVAQFLVILYIG